MRVLASLFSVSSLTFLVAAIILFTLEFNGFAADPGVGWHLKTGEFVLHHEVVPGHDPFLSADRPRQWVADQWFSDLLFYKAYQAGDWPLLYTLLGVSYLATFFIVLNGALRLEGNSFIASSIGSFLAFKFATIHFILRPVQLSFLCFALLLWLLYRYKADQGRPLSSLLWLPVLFSVWANIHPSFVTGLLLLGLFIVTEWSRQISLSELSFAYLFKQLRHVKWLLFILFISLAVTAINPYGFDLHKSIFSLGSNQFFMNLHQEWQSIKLGTEEGKMFLLMIVLIPVLMWLTGIDRFSRFEVLGFCVFAVLTFYSVRFLPYFAMVMSFSFAKGLSGLKQIGFIKGLAFYKPIAAATGKIEQRETQAIKLYWLVLFFSLVTLYSAFNGKVLLHQGELGPSSKLFPYESVSELKKIPGNHVVLSTPDWGGFLTFNELVPVIDDRNTLVGEAFYKRYLDARQSASDWIDFAERQQATHYLLRMQDELVDELLSRNCKALYADEVAVLFSACVMR